MAYLFGDGFDSYAAISDAALNYWDFGNFAGILLTPGRFSNSQALRVFSTTNVVVLSKFSGVNDSVHHIVCAFMQNATISGTSMVSILQLQDGTTSQCSINFRSDGTIILTQGGAGGTVLATYAGAFPTISTWYAFEFEVVIHNTTGSFRVRKNGSPTDDHATININTRGGTTNNYANRLNLAVGPNSVNSQNFDDILWRSDAASVPWVGDVRCYSRMPVSDVSTTFTRSQSSAVISSGNNNTGFDGGGSARYVQFVPTFSGTVAAVGIPILTAFTGNLKGAIFADNAGSPGAVLATSAVMVNGVIGTGTLTFTPPFAVTKGVTYWVGVNHDVAVQVGIHSSLFLSKVGTGVPYASFPAASPVVGGFTNSMGYTMTITITVNADMVNEVLQDSSTTYIYSSNPTDADFYTIAPLAQTPASVIAVITRGLIQKSDAGTRTGTVQLKSGATTVAAPTVSLNTNFGWVYRADATDPATGLAWTPAAVNAVNIGPLVLS
jgi:hypothetical protein